MDPKKQNLSPELKQVYDRVMSTSAQPQTAPPTASAAPAPTASNSPAIGFQTPAPAANPASPFSQATSVPAGAPSATASPAANPSTPNAMGAPGSFVFNGNKVISPQGVKPAAAAGTGKKIPGFLIVIGVILLIVVWTALWAYVFGVIKF